MATYGGQFTLTNILRQYVLMAGKTRTVRQWCYVRDDRDAGSEMPPAVWFAYSPAGKVSIHKITWPVTAVCFKPMLTVATGRYTNQAE